MPRGGWDVPGWDVAGWDIAIADKHGQAARKEKQEEAITQSSRWDRCSLHCQTAHPGPRARGNGQHLLRGGGSKPGTV